MRSSKRECPQCHQVKTFPVRNKFCSPECSSDNQRKAENSFDLTESSTIANGTWQIALPSTRIHTLDQLIKHFEVDLGEWEVEKFVVNKWEVGRKDRAVEWKSVDGMGTGSIRDSGKIHVEPLYQVKAFLRRKTAVISVREELDSMMREFQSTAPRFKVVKRGKRKPAGNVLELTIPDLHVGKLAWGRETGYGDYDIRIAERTFDTAVDTLIERTNSFTFDEIIVVIGNDLLNADNAAGTTTAGTPVTNDSRYQKTFEVARLMLTRAIEKLRELAPVRVVVVAGNHDELSAWHMGHSLACYFHKAADVTIDNEPRKRKYYQIGNVMLMWTHGDEGKRLDYPLLMATEQPAMFGATKYREAHTGDKHQTRLEEVHGVRIRILPSLCQPDAWHSRKGFVGNLTSAEAYVWNRETGLIGTAIYTVE